LKQAKEEGIPIPYGGWYPGTGNIGWGYSLTKERKKADCDRAGLVDLTRRPDGTLERVLCRDLVQAVLGLVRPDAPKTPEFLPMLEMPVMASASASGD
jgi:hypothetical protein